MKTVIVRYTVKPDKSEENQGLIKKVFEQLAHENPNGLKYMSTVSEDGLNFTHIAMLENADDNPLGRTEAFKVFTAEIKERCQVPPQAINVEVVGSYGF